KATTSGRSAASCSTTISSRSSKSAPLPMSPDHGPPCRRLKVTTRTVSAWLWPTVIASRRLATTTGRQRIARGVSEAPAASLRLPHRQALAGGENARCLDVVDHGPLLSELVHRAGHADPRHQLLLSSVLDLGHGELLPLGFSAVANLLGPEPVALDVGPQAVMLLDEEAVRPAAGRVHDHPPGTGGEDPRRDPSDFEASPGSGRDRVRLLAGPIDRAAVADDLASVGVHLHRDDGHVEALAIVVQVHLDIDERVTQPLPVERPIGVRPVDPFFEVPAGEPLRHVRLAPHLDGVVLG